MPSPGSVQKGGRDGPLADDLEDYAQNIVDTVREPLLTSRDRQLRVLGLSTIVAAVITHVTFRYAFTSVWCFFAALLLAHICYVLYRLPLRDERPVTRELAPAS